MTIKVADVLSRAAVLLNDATFIRWPKAELFMWINDAAAEIVIRRPSARAVTAPVVLVAGAYQQLPATALELLDIIRNVTAGGAAGRSVRRVDRQLLDDQLLDWQGSKQRDTVKHFTFDEATPTVFYVYPPAKAGTTITALYSETPPAIDDDADDILLDRGYIGPIVSYVLYRALAKDAEAASPALAAAHFQAFTEALGAGAEVVNAASPNVRAV